MHVGWVVAVVVVVLLVGAAIIAIVLRGHLSGSARAGDLEFQVAGGRKASPSPARRASRAPKLDATPPPPAPAGRRSETARLAGT